MAQNERAPSEDAGRDPWEAHELAQLRYFRSLPLRVKLQAVEGMADVVRRFDQMRRSGGFRTLTPALKRAQEQDSAG